VNPRVQKRKLKNKKAKERRSKRKKIREEYEQGLQDEGAAMVLKKLGMSPDEFETRIAQ